MKEYHEILGLEEGASQEEIQVAYENLSNKLNPNNNNNDEFFVEKYNKVQKAYKVLNNSSILGDKSIPSDKTPISATNLKSTKQSNRSNMKVL
jgi:curved DNA-binding protein CbpA